MTIIVDSKEHCIDHPEEIILALVSGALKMKAKEKSYGTFTIEIGFKDGWPGRLEVTDKTTHLFRHG